MLSFSNILIPIDLQASMPMVTDAAVDLSRRLGAERITFFHVLPQPPDLSDYKPYSLEQLVQSFQVRAEERMQEVLASMTSLVPTAEGLVVRGEIAATILAYARDHRIDCIVLATHGGEGLERAILGSVADRIIKEAPCPTLVFNPFVKERGYAVCNPLSSCVQPM